jgi:hypothetical protein
MGIRFPEPPAGIDALGPRVGEGLLMIGEPLPPGAQLRLIAPLPVHAPAPPSPRGHDRNALRWSRTTLWRALVLANGEPVATVEFRAAAPGGAAVRGRDSAKALFDALSLAETFGWAQAQIFDIGFVAAPRLFVTAVWLHGPRSVFFPTRTGAARRNAPDIYSAPIFRKLLRQTRKRMRRPAGRVMGRPAANAITNGLPA